METQTTVLDVVTSRENTRENTKDKFSATTTTTKSTKITYTTTFLHEHNTCQDQPQFEHEIF